VHGSRHLTVFGESFGGCLAIRLALAAPDLVSQLVLLNPATNFAENNALASFCARTGLLAFFPGPLYGLGQVSTSLFLSNSFICAFLGLVQLLFYCHLHFKRETLPLCL
jgi:pimeloyl-ACP methyl ester carboxylesterase